MNTRYTHLPYFVCLMMSFMMAGSLRAMDDNTSITAAASGPGVDEEYVVVSEQSQQLLRNRRGAGRDNNQQYNNLRWELLDAIDGARLATKEQALKCARFFWNTRQDDMAAAWVTRAQDLGATEAELQHGLIHSSVGAIERFEKRLRQESVNALVRCVVGDHKKYMTRIKNCLTSPLTSPPEKRAENKWKNHNE